MVFHVIMQQAAQGRVISELIEVSVRMGTSTTISVQDVQESLCWCCVYPTHGGLILTHCEGWLRKSSSHKTSPPSKEKSRMSLCARMEGWIVLKAEEKLTNRTLTWDLASRCLDHVEENKNDIINSSARLICKLKWINQLLGDAENMMTFQRFLKAFHF
jgi:hypothetical protein